jgi:predicted nucleotidyltransferase component of viral defense system
MIPAREVLALRTEWSLRADVIEKDWALGWVLAGIAAHPQLSTWIFKGGTCLRKCYYETYRFSEDLDFTVVGDGPEEPEQIIPIFREVASWLADEAGLEMQIDDRSFIRRRNLRGMSTTLGRVAYRGPSNLLTMTTPPKLKIDLTSDELIVNRPVRRGVMHPYSDAPQPLAAINSYSIVDLLAEKLRALAQRCRPRDLYDVVFLFRHPRPARARAGRR